MQQLTFKEQAWLDHVNQASAVVIHKIKGV